MKKPPLIQLDFGSVAIYKNHMIAIMDEGITIKPEFNDILKDIVEEYYPDKPFAYISRRLNSYAVDPTIYKRCSEIENLVGIAVVSNQPYSKSSVNVEKLFYDKLFVYYNDLDSAIKWADGVTQNPASENQPS